jgi:hypothetical protein
MLFLVRVEKEKVEVMGEVIGTKFVMRQPVEKGIRKVDLSKIKNWYEKDLTKKT